jgi:hypothetical protein
MLSLLGAQTLTINSLKTDAISRTSSLLVSLASCSLRLVPKAHNRATRSSKLALLSTRGYLSSTASKLGKLYTACRQLLKNKRVDGLVWGAYVVCTLIRMRVGQSNHLIGVPKPGLLAGLQASLPAWLPKVATSWPA